MKIFNYLTSGAILMCAASASLMGGTDYVDRTNEIPEIHAIQKYEKIKNVAEYGEASWDNVVGIARGITPSEAYNIAESDPQISYFFYTKGGQMVLGDGKGGWRIFRHGDTVFFSGEPWWGSAQDLADGYIKLGDHS